MISTHIKLKVCQWVVGGVHVGAGKPPIIEEQIIHKDRIKEVIRSPFPGSECILSIENETNSLNVANKFEELEQKLCTK